MNKLTGLRQRPLQVSTDPPLARHRRVRRLRGQRLVLRRDHRGRRSHLSLSLSRW